jgi:hypothetical protein
MAVTLTKVAATPYCLKYTWLGTGNDSGSKTAAQLIADCAAGPLKELLTQVSGGLNAGVTGLNWAGLMHSALVSVYVIVEASSGALSSEIGAAFNSGANRFDFFCNIGVSTENGTIEIRYWPSAVR